MPRSQHGQTTCPTCNRDDFDSERAMKIHHQRTHGESLAGTAIPCEHCGAIVRRKPNKVESQDNVFCDINCRSAWRSENLVGDAHWNWDGGTETLVCEWCSDEYERKPAEAEDSRFCSHECFGKWRSDAQKGEGHWNWKGGRADDYGKRWESWKEHIRKRDRDCQNCGADGSDAILDVHHIVPRRAFDVVSEANTEGNLILLCRSCHHKVEKGTITCPEPEVSE